MVWLCYLPLVFACWQLAGFLTDYGVAWQHVEVEHWKPEIAGWGFPDSFSALWRVFDWRVIEEGDPRITRPLASLFELYDTPLRMMLWRHMVLLPSLSLTWIFTLFLSPLLLFLLLRNLGVSRWIVLLAMALYISNPGVMSLAVNLYRPGKSLAIFAILLSLWLGSRQELARRHGSSEVSLNVRFTWLCLVTFIGFFTDETALIAYPALFLLFPRLVFRNLTTGISFFLVPVAYALVVKEVMPALAAHAGYPLALGRYDAEVSLEKLLTLQFPPSSYITEIFNIIANTLYILPDCLGLIRPDLTHSFYYTGIFCLIVALCFSYASTIRGVWRQTLGPRNAMFEDTPSGLAWRALLTLAVALIYESVLMSVSLTNHIILRPWALYWYGVFCAIFVILAAALVVRLIRPPVIFAILFTAGVVAGSTYVFPATNQVYKDVHYYPYHPSALDGFFANNANRFDEPRSDSALLKAKTTELWRTKQAHQPVYDAPLELSYMLYELSILPVATPCKTHYFDLAWIAEKVTISCHEAPL